VSSLWPVSGDADEILALLREWDAADEPRPLVIETSGSTGRPKRVILSRDAMRFSALATQERLGGPGQWVLNLPPTYVAGVQVLYRSVVAGTEPVVMRERDDFDTAWRRMSADRRYVSLVPTQLFRQLDDGFKVRDLGRFTAVLVGGGPMAPGTRPEAESMGIRVVQTYGMSETCGGCVYDGVPFDGVEVRIDHDHRVLLRGPVLFDGYEGEPERTAAAFRDGWLVTGDLGHWAVDGRLRIDGRVDDMIITGGVKVSGGAVARLLSELSFVDAVEVVGVPDDEWGEAVTAVAAGVPDVPTPVIEAELDALEARFPDRAWWPKRWVRVDEIPLLPNGKPDRVALKNLAADA
jgi:O-succinylbenzoic acid--CoA ligase